MWRQSCNVASRLPSTTKRLQDLISPDRDIPRPTIMVRGSAGSVLGGISDGLYEGLGASVFGRFNSLNRAGILVCAVDRAGRIGIPRSSTFSAIFSPSLGFIGPETSPRNSVIIPAAPHPNKEHPLRACRPSSCSVIPSGTYNLKQTKTTRLLTQRFPDLNNSSVASDQALYTTETP